jgi:hypothetical protein
MSSKSELSSSHDYAVTVQLAPLLVYPQDAGINRWRSKLGCIYAWYQPEWRERTRPKSRHYFLFQSGHAMI